MTVDWGDPIYSLGNSLFFYRVMAGGKCMWLEPQATYTHDSLQVSSPRSALKVHTATGEDYQPITARHISFFGVNYEQKIRHTGACQEIVPSNLLIHDITISRHFDFRPARHNTSTSADGPVFVGTKCHDVKLRHGRLQRHVC